MMKTTQNQPAASSTIVQPPLYNTQYYTWHRTPSQIVYEVAPLTASTHNELQGLYPDIVDESYRQSANGHAAIYMFFGVTCLAAMSFLSKLAYENTSVTPVEVAYARFLGMIIGNVCITCCVDHTILEVSTGLEKSLLIRALAGTVAHMCYCYSLYFLNCSLAIVLNTTSHFVNTMVSLFQRQMFPKITVAVSILSATGICLLVYCGGFWTIVPLMGSLGMVVSFTLVRQMKGEIFYVVPPTYLGICGAIISSWGMLLWHTSGSSTFQTKSLLYLASISLFGWLSQILQAWAQLSESSWRINLLSYLIVIYAFGFDACVGSAGAFSTVTLIGAGLLAGSNVLHAILG